MKQTKNHSLTVEVRYCQRCGFDHPYTNHAAAVAQALTGPGNCTRCNSFDDDRDDAGVCAYCNSEDGQDDARLESIEYLSDPTDHRDAGYGLAVSLLGLIEGLFTGEGVDPLIERSLATHVTRTSNTDTGFTVTLTNGKTFQVDVREMTI